MEDAEGRERVRGLDGEGHVVVTACRTAVEAQDDPERRERLGEMVKEKLAPRRLARRMQRHEAAR